MKTPKYPPTIPADPPKIDLSPTHQRYHDRMVVVDGLFSLVDRIALRVPEITKRLICDDRSLNPEYTIQISGKFQDSFGIKHRLSATLRIQTEVVDEF